MKHLALLAFVLIFFAGCTKKEEPKPQPVEKMFTYTVVTSADAATAGTVPVYTITGTDIKPVTVSTGSYTFSLDLPFEKSTTIEVEGTTGNPMIHFSLYKTKDLTSQNLKIKTSANKISVQFMAGVDVPFAFIN